MANNLDDLNAVLADPTHGWLIPDAATKILNPVSPDWLGITIAEQIADADDLALIYYAGHGLLSSRGDLYLATSRTNRKQLRFTAFPFDGIREILNDSPAANRVVILDCCYSGRAAAAMTDPRSSAYDQLGITGTYILTSTTATTISHAPKGARHTAFTGELIRLLRSGDPNIPELITLDHIYRATYRSLIRQGFPRPQQRGSDATPHLALVRNHAFDHPQLEAELSAPSDDSRRTSPLPVRPLAVAPSAPSRGEVDRGVAAYPRPRPLNPQPSFPRSPYQQLPVSAFVIAVAAIILCTVSCLLLATSAVSFLNGSIVVDSDMPLSVDAIANLTWTGGDILVVVGTIWMWRRKPVGRMQAIIGLSMVVSSSLGVEIVALSGSRHVIMTPLAYLINVFTVLSLAFVLLPGTRRYLRARRFALYQSPSHRAGTLP